MSAGDEKTLTWATPDFSANALKGVWTVVNKRDAILDGAFDKEED